MLFRHDRHDRGSLLDEQRTTSGVSRIASRRRSTACCRRRRRHAWPPAAQRGNERAGLPGQHHAQAMTEQPRAQRLGVSSASSRCRSTATRVGDPFDFVEVVRREQRPRGCRRAGAGSARGRRARSPDRGLTSARRAARCPGLCSSVRASATRCFSPFDSSAAGSSARSAMPKVASDRSTTAPGRRQAVQPGVGQQVLP